MMYKVVIIRAIIILLSIGLFIVGINSLFLNDAGSENKGHSENDYETFKKNTSVINGNVKDRYIQKYNDNKVYYLAISQKDNNDVLVNVNEAEYKAYKEGMKVKFRVAKYKDNKTIVDLNKNKDIDSNKAFKKYKEQKNSEIWGSFKSVYQGE